MPRCGSLYLLDNANSLNPDRIVVEGTGRIRMGYGADKYNLDDMALASEFDQVYLPFPKEYTDLPRERATLLPR